jgi:two-component system, NtrC family, sensor kinase
VKFDLSDFSLVDMLQCGRGIRQAASSAATVGEAAQAMVEYLYRECGHPRAARSCALIRFYKTFSYVDLEPQLQSFAKRQLGDLEPEDQMKVLTLLATIGQQPEWCDARQSVAHRAIPLPSAQMVEGAPMIAELIRELGLDIAEVVKPGRSSVKETEGRSYDVFHVEKAKGSPYIPAQAEFVERYGIRSVLGFGGLLGDGNFYSIVMFSKGAVSKESASRFRNIALDVKAVLHPFAVNSGTLARLI